MCQARQAVDVGVLAGMTEIAAMLGVSRQRVHQIMREDPSFPAPFDADLAAGKVWMKADVERWAREKGRI